MSRFRAPVNHPGLTAPREGADGGSFHPETLVQTPENNCRFSRDRGILREGDRLSEIARIQRLKAEVA
jgi:hypothetical protein